MMNRLRTGPFFWLVGLLCCFWGLFVQPAHAQRAPAAKAPTVKAAYHKKQPVKKASPKKIIPPARRAPKKKTSQTSRNNASYDDLKPLSAKNTTQLTTIDRKPEAPFTVVIDPGHGGFDPGNERSSEKYLHEKVITLAIGLQVGQMIEDNLSNVKVVYTRKSDVFRSLANRALIANSSEADCFLSIHCNSNPYPSIKGVQVHIHDQAFLKSKKLAQSIEYELKTSAGRQMRGIYNAKDRRHNLYVLQYTTMPGALIELGFMSNPKEEKFLNTDEGQEALAIAIYRGFVNYLAKVGHEVQIKAAPDVAAEVKNDASGAGKYRYKVQITASDKRIPLSHLEFKKLKMKVEERKSANEKAVLKYRYLVGDEDTLAAANELARKVRTKGFKDAFVTKVQDN
jgi:N-acetylmuramoyl-L-alanine amidase